MVIDEHYIFDKLTYHSGEKPLHDYIIHNAEKYPNETMAAYKYPRAVEFIENLPTTQAGKVLRRLLKES